MREPLRNAKSRITLDFFAQAGAEEKREQRNIVEKLLRKAVIGCDDVGP